MSAPPPRRIVLVGFMGSGKTSVGRGVARELGWRFADLDEAIEAEEGACISDIFAAWGEAHFRAVEERLAQALLSSEGLVLASGGGWAATPGRLDDLPESTETFWLKVTPEEALRRAGTQPGARPLLGEERPVEEVRLLLSDRERFYARARWAVDTEGRSVEDVTARILEILSQEYLLKKAE